jgi:diadenosine tetraphosphate (Ap4A) HIT family hydrolase
VSTWPEDFEDLKSGLGCVMCDDGRPDDNGFGPRIMAGAHSDAYLQREGFHRGYVVVIHRGDRHVTEFMDLTSDETQAYWQEVLRVARAVSDFYRPMKMNLMVLGNALPHLHTHVVPRYEDDADAGGPPVFDIEGPRIESKVAFDAHALRMRLGANSDNDRS